MRLSSSSEDAFGAVTLGLVVLVCALGSFSVVYVFRFRSRIHRERLSALKEFNAPWLVRAILVSLAVFWGLVEILRLPLIRKKGWLLHALGFQWQANMCRLYVLLSLGLAEPCFFLSAMFLIRESMCEAPFSPRKRWKGKVIGKLLGLCLPVFLLQLFFVVISPAFEFRKGYKPEQEGYGTLPDYFTKAFQTRYTENDERIAVCTFPLFSTIVLGLFGVVFISHFLYLGWRMILLVINRRLQIRVYGLVAAVVVLLPVHVLLLGLSVLSEPREAMFEVLVFLGFLTVMLCTAVGEWILVIRPISDALAVQPVFGSPRISKSSRQNSWGAIPTDHFSISLSAFASGDCYTPSPAASEELNQNSLQMAFLHEKEEDKRRHSHSHSHDEEASSSTNPFLFS